MLNRLAYELQERKRLCQQLDALKAKKSTLTGSNGSKKEFVGGLVSKLKGLEEAAKPLQENLMSAALEQPTEPSSALLPRALYILHEHACAYRDTFDSRVRVSVEGDQAAARALCKEGKEEDGEEGGFDATHPLSVAVRVAGSSLRFVLMVKLRVISVEGPIGPLSALFPNDDGGHSPNPANSQHLPSHSTLWEESLPGRPYQWAQWLGGLSFLRSEPHHTSSTIPREPFKAVMDALKATA